MEDFKAAVLIVLGLLCVTIILLWHYEATHPCLRSETRTVTAYQRIGETWVPVPYTQVICLERKGH
jgi:hypothetical protein